MKASVTSMSESFLMPVEDVFTITGRGTVATGRIERGEIKQDDLVEIVGLSNTIIKSKVTGVEVFRKILSEAGKDDNVGLLLRGVAKSQIQRGMVICTPGSIGAYTEFKCEITLMKSDESKIVKPVTSSDSLQFYFRTVDISGMITFSALKELQPSPTTAATVILARPVAMEKDLNFALRDSAKTIGLGRLTVMIK
jgi:elongation factor Tu